MERQVISLPFRGGLDKKTDPKQVEATKVSVLENGVFTRPGRIDKRNGFASLARSLETGVGEALFSYKDELLAADGSTLWSWADAANLWVDKGTLRSVDVTKRSIFREQRNQTSPDVARHSSGTELWVWEGGKGQIQYSVIDSTGQFVVQNQSISGTTDCKRPRVVVQNNRFVIYWLDTSSVIYAATLAVDNPQGAVTGSVVTSNIADTNSVNQTYPLYDVMCSPTNVIYLYFNHRDATAGQSLWRFSGASVTTATAKVYWDEFEDSYGFNVFWDRYMQGPVVCYANPAVVRMRSYSGPLVDDTNTPVILAFGDLGSSIAGEVKLTTGVSLSDTSLDLQFFWSDTGSYVTYSAGITGSDYQWILTGMPPIPQLYITQAAAVFRRSVVLCTKAFAYNDQAFVALVYVSSVQPTYFVADRDATIVARILPGNGGTLTTAGTVSFPWPQIPNAPVYGDGSTVILPLRERTLLDGEVGGLFSYLGIVGAYLDFFEPTRSYSRAEIANVEHVSGGFLSMYDGTQVVEHGFHLYPEAVVPPAPAGAISYSYVSVYTWTDNRGNIHRSAPSPAVTHTQAVAIDGANPAALTLTSLRITDKPGWDSSSTTGVRIEVYRTEAAGTVYYRCTPTAPTNNAAADTVPYSDTTTDAALVGNPLLYTSGNVVENIPTPPAGVVVAHRNRLFMLDSTNPLSVWYSKQITPDVPAEFSDLFTINVDPAGGDVTGMASMDDKLILFKEHSVFALTGQGPDDTGGQNDFSDTVLVTSDTGCTNKRSIVMTPAGLLFQSPKGVKLLTRNLELMDIGAPVEELIDGQTVTGGVLAQNADRVILTLDNQTALVYDYFVGQWASFTNVAAVDCTVWDSNFAFLRSDGTALVETPGEYTDNGSHIPLKVVSAWIQAAQMQGFQRVRRIMVLGGLEGDDHTLRVSVAYDFNTEDSEVVDIAVTAPYVYGGSSPYGDEDVYGGEFPLYQWLFKPARQKCEAIRVTIEDVTGATPGRNLNLSGLALEVGAKRGLQKLPASKSLT